MQACRPGWSGAAHCTARRCSPAAQTWLQGRAAGDAWRHERCRLAVCEWATPSGVRWTAPAAAAGARPTSRTGHPACSHQATWWQTPGQATPAGCGGRAVGLQLRQRALWGSAASPCTWTRVSGSLEPSEAQQLGSPWYVCPIHPRPPSESHLRLDGRPRESGARRGAQTQAQWRPHRRPRRGERSCRCALP